MKKYFLAIILMSAAFNLFSQTYWSPYPHGLFYSVAYMQAVDKNVVWGIGGQDEWSLARDVIRTIDGGITWTHYSIDVQDMNSIPGMISAVDAMHAWVIMYGKEGATGYKEGIYATSDGGSSWIYQTSADFPGLGSFPDCVHFFNATDGWCLGDPGTVSGVFEIYTTNDGGTTWHQVPDQNIPDCLPTEVGYIGYCCSVGDTSWFGTSRGRIFRSADKGHTWTASAISGWTILPAKPTFRDHLHGLVQNMSSQYTGNFVATSDGGTTWTPITYSYPGFYSSLVFHNLSYIPGTTDTYVGSGYYGILAKSNDGGHSWEAMQTPPEVPPDYFSVWIDAETGWLSSFTYVYKFTGNLGPPVANFTTSDTSVITGSSVSFTNLSQNATSYEWTFPGGNPGTSTVVNPVVTYSIQGTYNATLTATNENSSATMTKYDYIKVSDNGIFRNSAATISVSPNPAKDHFKICSTGIINEFSLTDFTGIEIYSQKAGKKEITVSNLSCKPGLYILKMLQNDGICSMKIVIL